MAISSIWEVMQKNIFTIDYQDPALNSSNVCGDERVGYSFGICTEDFSLRTDFLYSGEEFVILDVKPKIFPYNEIAIQVFVMGREIPVIGWIRPTREFILDHWNKVL